MRKETDELSNYNEYFIMLSNGFADKIHNKYLAKSHRCFRDV